MTKLGKNRSVFPKHWIAIAEQRDPLLEGNQLRHVENICQEKNVYVRVAVDPNMVRLRTYESDTSYKRELV